MKEKLIKLIKDYGESMYDLGECTGDSNDYEAKQVGLTRWKLLGFIDAIEIKEKEDWLNDKKS